MHDVLTNSQRVTLRQAHKAEHDKKIGDRMKTVIMADKGKACSEIAEFLLADEQTVRRHIKNYVDKDIFGGDREARKACSTRVRPNVSKSFLPPARSPRPLSRPISLVDYSELVFLSPA